MIFYTVCARRGFYCVLLVLFSLLHYKLFCLTENRPAYELNVVTTSPVYLYSEYGEYLYPFSHSQKVLKLKEGTILKVIEEIRPESPLFSDILKVKVISGYYKGESGYLPEYYVRLPGRAPLSVKVIFTRDIYDKEGRLIIKHNSRGVIIESKLFNNFESFIIETGSKEKKFLYHCFDKEEVVFVNSREQEIAYHLKRGSFVFKVVDGATLLPVGDVILNENWPSDEYGLVYIDKLPSSLTLKAAGYVSRTLKSSSLEQINLIVLQKAEVITVEQENFHLREKELDFLIQPGENKSLVLNIHERLDYHFFAYPAIDRVNRPIIRGFYIENVRPLALQLKVLLEAEEYSLLYYDPLLDNWIKQAAAEDHQYRVIKGGYYLLAGPEYAPIKVELKKKDIFHISPLLCMGKNGEYSREIANELRLSGGDHEMVYFSSKSPYYVITERKKISVSPVKDQITLDVSGNNETDVPAAFHRLFLGSWKSELVTKNGFPVDQAKPGSYRLEFLGDMKLTGVNAVEFRYHDLVLKGYITVVNDRQMYILINWSNHPFSFEKKLYKVSPSWYNTGLVIPAYYSLYAGYLQISFDKIYLARHRLYRENYSGRKPLLIGQVPSPFEKPAFPPEEGKANYIHYFRKL